MNTSPFTEVRHFDVRPAHLPGSGQRVISCLTHQLPARITELGLGRVTVTEVTRTGTEWTPKKGVRILLLG